MKRKTLTLMWVGMLVLAMILTSVPAAALTSDDFNFSGTDASGDVANANVDLISASTGVEGTDVLLTLTVSGNIIDNSDYYTYGFTLTDSGSESNMVLVTYTNGSANYFASSGFSDATADVSGSSLTIYLPLAVFTSFSGISMVSAHASYDNYDTSESMDDIILMLAGGESDSGGSGDSSGGYDSFPMPVKGPDPATETPTDTSISVSITYVHVVMQNKSDEVEIDMTVRGTTSGVDHVALGWSTYFKNGTHEWGGNWMVGPFEIQPNTDIPFGGGHIYEFYFKNTSADWKTWEFRMHTTMPHDANSSAYEKEDDIMDFDDVDHMRVYARAYSDSAGNNWNQAYYDLSLSVSDDGNTISGGTDVGSDTGSSGIPGFEAVVAVSALSMVAIAYGIRKRH